MLSPRLHKKQNIHTLPEIFDVQVRVQKKLIKQAPHTKNKHEM